MPVPQSRHVEWGKRPKVDMVIGPSKMELNSTENLKPLAYLDHNILDFLIKYEGEPLRSDLINNYQVVFSDENLNEIEKSSNMSRAFYTPLSLSTLCICNDGNNAFLKDISPTALFNELKNMPPLVREFENSMNEIALKLNVGGEVADDIFEKSAKHFSTIMDDFKTQAEYYGVTELFGNEFFDRLKDQYLEQVKTAVEYYERVVKEEGKYLGPIDFRGRFGTSALELNNIEPPGVVLKIWELIKERNGLSEQNSSLTRVLGLDRDVFAPSKPVSLFGKAMNVYHFLNWIGYYGDSKLKKPKRFYSSMSDQIHGAYGIFAKRIFTMDERFARKLDAAYEFLKIKTEVVMVKTYTNGDLRCSDDWAVS